MTYDIDFTGKHILVVGGSSGIGNAIAQAFRSKGGSVQVWGTRASAADYAGTAGSDLTGLAYTQVDASSPEQIRNACSHIDQLDVLVQCQGLVLYKRQEFTSAGFRRVVDTNLNSLMDCCEQLHPLLKASQGSIIIMSSTAAFHSARGNPAYCASKTGAMGLTRTLGDIWARDGIRVNGIAPGLVPTKMTTATTENPDAAQSMLSNIPLGRFGKTEEIAGVALFLASPLSTYVIGQTLPVDGGLTLR
ncbi:MAG: SDR family oxidoreductase [Gammaproteobacteria bacterium]|nr:SDR family oxidoreductase [Gammaproteobacteria bacterium]